MAEDAESGTVNLRAAHSYKTGAALSPYSLWQLSVTSKEPAMPDTFTNAASQDAPAAALPQGARRTHQPPYRAIRFADKLSLIDDQWQQRVVAEMNDYQFKLVKIEGDFIWHDHADTDETFIVLDGELRIDFRDGAVNLAAGDMYVVPRGVEHKPYAEKEVQMLLIEPRGVKNTGSVDSERTAANDMWI
jgi:mannose-6-phosphate isomerase-like protein (cupin superfamily)